jgi:penicillin-binding protein 1A
MLRFLRGLARVFFCLVVVAGVGIGVVVGLTLAYYGRDLPNTQQLVDYVPAVGSKVYAGDGTQIAEFESEHRIPVTIGQVPPLVIHAFLAAEDRDFYNHPGIDPAAIVRAAMSDLLRMRRGQRPIGASTITQQVVRHFLLSNEVSLARKIKEAILAYRIEHTLSKDRILEIYLNEIYFGAGSYGVAAAAATYFQKPLDQLNVAEAAFLAALPKAPNNYNPARHPVAALARRNWVIAGMADVGWITQAQAKVAIAESLGVQFRTEPSGTPAGLSGYFAEEVRRELIARYGEKAVYEGGLSVRTSYVPVYQQMAATAFRNGLVEYDRRHGWRGPLVHLPTGAAAEVALTGMADPPGADGWRPAAVMAADYRDATIALRNGSRGQIPLSEMLWARRTLPDQRVGASVRGARDVLAPGDIVLVEPTAAADAPSRSRHAAPALPSYALRQIPNVSGGVVVMDPHTGRVFAVVGGWSYRQSQFDRATQAMRQPGSAFKPFVYVTALEKGFTPDTMVDDSPVDLPQGPGLPSWQPVNYEGGYIGPTTLEDALVHSRNLATVHVAMTIGLPPIAKTVEQFGILDKMPLYYSMVLGAGDTTLVRLTTAYAMLDNGGHWLTSSLIDLVQDRNGRILYEKGVGGCAACFVTAGNGSATDSGGLYRPAGAADPASIYLPNATWADNATLYKPTKPDPLVSRDADTEILSMMQGVVQRGTGIAVAAVGKPLAGKTGTTSNWFDAWFVGFSPDIAAGVFVGFDEPRTLGDGEVGGHVAAPIFRDFMAAALKDKPATPFPAPPTPAPPVASAAGQPVDPDADPADGYAANPDDPDAAAADREASGNDGAGAGSAFPPPPPGQGYAGPPRDYVAARGPGYPPAWQSYYGQGARGYPPPPQRLPGMPPYPAPPGWMQPGRGTGGLY